MVDAAANKKEERQGGEKWPSFEKSLDYRANKFF